ncbi:MAG: TMEM175 family protein [Bacteroidota bacterium]
MIREQLSNTQYGKETGFRLRGGEISRIEGFSDNVFGFALTLLVVTLDVPKTFSQLEETFHGFIGFALAFSLLVVVWYDHYQFFRRFGLNDRFVLWMNFVLLFVVVFFVYPTKFLATLLVKMFSGMSINVTLADGTVARAIENHQWPTMMIAYGIGFIIIYAIYFFLYLHAYQQREQLELTATELVHTKGEMVGHCANCIIGLLSISFVIFGGPGMAFYSGMTYWLIGPTQGVIGYHRGKKIRTLLDQKN